MKSSIYSKASVCARTGKAWPAVLVLSSLMVILTQIAAVEHAESAEAYVVDVVKAEQERRISVSATLKGALTPEIKDAVASGAPVAFTYFVRLERVRSLVWDETVREIAIKRMVKFDTLTKKYMTWEKRAEDEDDIDFKKELARLDYKNKTGDTAHGVKTDKIQGETEPVLDPVILKKRGALERWMTRLENLDTGPVDEIKKPGRYYFRVKCKMKSIKLVPPFNYILFFMSFLDFDTDWTRSTIFTLGAENREKIIHPAFPDEDN